MKPLHLAAALPLALARAARAASPRPEGYGLPVDASVDGFRVDELIHFTLVSITVIFVIVAGMLLVSLVRHRRGHAARYAPGSKASIGFALGFVALVLVVVDGTLFMHTIVDMRHVFWNFAGGGGPPRRRAHRGAGPPVGVGGRATPGPTGSSTRRTTS